MPPPTGFQTRRFEYKYVIPPDLVRPIARFASAYIQSDPHAGPEGDYPVYSLYLDTPSLATCRWTLQGQKNRFKLRIRYYDHSADSPVYFEVKRRLHDVIVKQRAAVRRQAVGDLLAGQWPRARHLARPCDDGEQLGPLQAFCSLRDQLQARGAVFVSYDREAYASADGLVRLTFDRHLTAAPFLALSGFTRAVRSLPVPLAGVVLELKFTERFPKWMLHMVHLFNLERTSMAKYVACATRLHAVQGQIFSPYVEPVA